MRTHKQSDAQRISKLKKAIADFKSLAYSKEVVEQYERQLNELQESRQAEKQSRKERVAENTLSQIARVQVNLLI